MTLATIPEGAQRPPKKAIWSWTVDTVFWGVIGALPVSTFGFIVIMGAVSRADRFWFLGILVAMYGVLVVGAAVLVPRIRYRHTYYVVSSDQVLIQRGAFWIKRVVVPYARIQNIDTQHGPFDRKLGLINVKLHTAASPITIHNISTETGEAIRDEMMRRVKSVRDELVA